MKKLFITAVAILIFAFHSNVNAAFDTKDDKEDSISAYIHNNASKITWSVYQNYNVAMFAKDGHIVKAFYNEQGNLVSTTRALNNRNELPKVALDKLDSNYSEWGMTDLLEETGLDKETVYYARLTDGNRSMILKIRANGKINKF